MTFVFALCALLAAGSATAQTATPPTQSAPPAGQAAQKPDPQKPATPPAPPKPLPFPADARIAFIDIGMIMEQSALGKKGQDAMKALNDKLMAGLTDKNNQIKAMQDKIKSQQNVVAEPVLQAMARELDKLQREAQFQQQDAQVQVDQLNQELIKNFQDQVLPIVEDVRKEKNLWLIFALGQQSNIAAGDAALDLTMEIVKRLDAKSK
jgi:Skp family chaperone for outer membrane proteins